MSKMRPVHCRPQQLFYCLALVAYFLYSGLYYYKPLAVSHRNGNAFAIVHSSPEWDAYSTSGSYSSLSTSPLDPGWDRRGKSLYDLHRARAENTGHRNVTLQKFRHRGWFLVSEDEGSLNSGFWERAVSGRWEPRTYAMFEKHVGRNTTVVDFGTWIGPTLLHHGSFSRRSLGIEADPAAFAVAERNVWLNRGRPWGGRVSVHAGCVAAPEDVGPLEMKAGGAPGASMSGISGKVYMDRGRNSVKWSVLCNTLPSIFEDNFRIGRPYIDVFIKIDIEGYECRLIPTFYDWLKGERYLPTMFIAFHPQIARCTEEQYEGVLKFLRLYNHVRPGDEEEFDVRKANVEDFARLRLGEGIVVYQDHHVAALKQFHN